MRGTRSGGGDGEPRDAGMTLMELMVTIGILAVIGTIIAAFSITTVRTTAGLQNRQDDAVQGELGLAAASKVLRTAVLPDQLEQLENQTCSGCQERAVLAATTTRVSFYADIETGSGTSIGPSLVTLRVEADPDHRGTGRLVQDTQPPRPSGTDGYTFCDPRSNGCVVNTRVLARGFVWPSPGVFTYYDYDGDRLNGTTLSSADLPRVQSVDLVFAVETDGLGADRPTRTALTRVRLPNVEISINTDGAI